MTVSHGIKALATLGQGQMGLGISYVSAVKAKVPRVYLVDSNPLQLDKGLKFFDTLLAKDVKKEKMTQQEADEARSRIKPLEKVSDLGKEGEVQMVIEVSRQDLVSRLNQFFLNPIRFMIVGMAQEIENLSCGTEQRSGDDRVRSIPLLNLHFSAQE